MAGLGGKVRSYATSWSAKWDPGAPVGGVGGEGVPEQAKSNFMERIQRTEAHLALVRIPVLSAKTLLCLFGKQSQSVRCAHGSGVAGVKEGALRDLENC